MYDKLKRLCYKGIAALGLDDEWDYVEREEVYFQEEKPHKRGVSPEERPDFLAEQTAKFEERMANYEPKEKEDYIKLHNHTKLEEIEHLGTIYLMDNGKVVGRVRKLEALDGTVYGCICEDVLERASILYLGDKLDIRVSNVLGILEFEDLGESNRLEVIREYQTILEQLQQYIKLTGMMRVQLYLWYQGELDKQTTL